MVEFKYEDYIPLSPSDRKFIEDKHIQDGAISIQYRFVDLKMMCFCFFSFSVTFFFSFQTRRYLFLQSWIVDVDVQKKDQKSNFVKKISPLLKRKEKRDAKRKIILLAKDLCYQNRSRIVIVCLVLYLLL